MNYYHVSETNYDKKTFKPRVPCSIMDQEDNRTKRVCFSTNIRGCLKAIDIELFLNFGDDEYFVHVPNNYSGKIYKPSVSEVPDVKDTREKWLLNRVNLKCIGKIKVYKSKRNKFIYKWIEKY